MNIQTTDTQANKDLIILVIYIPSFGEPKFYWY